MVFSYSQITHYLRCPRSYRYRYLDGWQEKEARATMIFGRLRGHSNPANEGHLKTGQR